MAKRRHRRSREEWQSLIVEYQASGLSAEEFCVDHDLGLRNFDRWRCVLTGPVQSKPLGFAEIKPKAPISKTAKGSASLAISLGEARLELPADASASRIANLMRALAHA